MRVRPLALGRFGPLQQLLSAGVAHLAPAQACSETHLISLHERRHVGGTSVRCNPVPTCEFARYLPFFLLPG
jgi:hypothetical protein